MNIILCPNKHHYDADEFDVCPHCPTGSEPVKKQIYEPVEKLKPFYESEKIQKLEKKIGLLKYLFLSTDEEKTITDHGFDKTKENVVSEAVHSNPKTDRESDAGLGLDAEADEGSSLSGSKLFDNPESVNKKAKAEETKGYFDERNSVEKSPNEDARSNSEIELKEKDEKEVSETLKENIKNVASRTEGKTLGYFEKKEKEESIEHSKKCRAFTEPVVGWIVAVAGPHFGESFPIVSGQNSIGRSSANKIVISKDNSVSREKHAQLIYDPKGLNFFLRAGESSGLVYLNGECFFDVKKLSKKDVIMLGESEFVFIPLCDESFSWESYLERK